MKCNIIKTDKIIRITIGLLAIGSAFLFNEPLGFIGIDPLSSAIMGRCPSFYPFAIKSCDIESSINKECHPKY